MDMPIGALAASTGVKVPTIRYYEQSGLMPVPPRTQSNRRLYDEDAARRLRFIRHARELGFEVDAIRALLELQGHPDRSCEAADQIAKERLEEVESKIARLSSLKAELERMIAGCAHGQAEHCKVIEVLADHAHCRHHHR